MGVMQILGFVLAQGFIETNMYFDYHPRSVTITIVPTTCLHKNNAMRHVFSF